VITIYYTTLQLNLDTFFLTLFPEPLPTQVRERINKVMELARNDKVRFKDPIVGEGFAVTSSLDVSPPLLKSMARAHAHSSTVMWDALSSLPPLRRGVQLGWRA
jgi:hypothetical protein